MRAGAQARTIFAGAGVTASLLAAVGAVFALTGGVLAFTEFPGAESAPPELSLDIAPAASAPTAAQAQPVALPAARTPVSAAATPTRRAAARTGGRPPRGTTPATTQPGTPSTGGPVTVEPGAPGSAPVQIDPPLANSQAGLAPVAAAVESTTSATARTVRAVGTSVPIAGPVTNVLAGAVDGAGAAVGGLSRGLSG